MRVLIPERMIPDLEYEIALDVWDPAGVPLATSEMIVIVVRPGVFERAHAARQGERAGHYVFTERFDEPGRHVFRVHPPGGEAALQLYVDVASTAPDPPS
jgi:hypothetical protein